MTVWSMRVPVCGTIMIGGQKIQVGLAHACKTAEVSVEAGTCQIIVEPGITITAPRTTSSGVRDEQTSLGYQITAGQNAAGGPAAVLRFDQRAIRGASSNWFALERELEAKVELDTASHRCFGSERRRAND